MKVLWLDDEHPKFIALKEEAILEDMELSGFDNALDGIKELETNFNQYDALILDGMFFLKKDDKKTTDKAFGEVAKTLENMRSKGKVLPVFIYSGQTNFVLDKHKYVDLFKENFQNDGKVFSKNNDDDFPLLLNSIKAAVQDNPNSKIRHQFNSVFQAINSIEALKKHQSTILDILKNIDTDQDFTKVRLVIESVFVALENVNIIPEGFTEEKGWINGTSLFISKKHSDYEFDGSNIIHPSISETLHSTLKIVQDASHNEGVLIYKLDEYSRSYKFGFLYKSIVYSLLETVCYFSEVIKNNQDKTINQSRWKKKENISRKEGVVCQDENGNYYAGQYIIAYNAIPEYAKIGDRIEILESKVNNKSNTKQTYPYFAIIIKKLI